jgi:hypothetical protein
MPSRGRYIVRIMEHGITRATRSHTGNRGGFPPRSSVSHFPGEKRKTALAPLRCQGRKKLDVQLLKLEAQFQSELNDPWIACGGDLPKGRAAKRNARGQRIGVIKSVK